MDPITAAGAAKVVGALSGEVAKTGLPSRLFGPLFDEMAASWADGYRRNNLEKIARRAARRPQLEEDAAGVIHARVAHRLLSDGSFVNDDVMQEYLAGLLSGSRTREGADDRAVYYVDLVARLPAVQVRLHHAVYAALASVGPRRDYGDGAFLQVHGVATDLADALEVAALPSGLSPVDALSEALIGLHREGLVSDFGVAPARRLGLQEGGDDFYMIAEPTHIGCQLALWAHGIRDADAERLPETVACNFDTPGPTFRRWEFKEAQDLQWMD